MFPGCIIRKRQSFAVWFQPSAADRFMATAASSTRMGLAMMVLFSMA
jgi:hypothetical protein